MRSRSRTRSNWHAERMRSATAIKGAVAGAAGVWAMDRVRWPLYRREDQQAVAQESAARVGALDVAHAMANKLAGLAAIKLQPRQPHPLGLVAHYALGVVPGAAYAALRPRVPRSAAGHGFAYGFALFVINDEIAAPLIGIASGPRAYPSAPSPISSSTPSTVEDKLLPAAERARGATRGRLYNRAKTAGAWDLPSRRCVAWERADT